MLPFSLTLVQKSATKMREELAELLEIFHKVEEAGGKATISITTSLGVTKTKLEIVSPTPGSSNATSSSSPWLWLEQPFGSPSFSPLLHWNSPHLWMSRH